MNRCNISPRYMKIKQCYMLIRSPGDIKLETRLVNNDIQFQLQLSAAADGAGDGASCICRTVFEQNVFVYVRAYSAACLPFILSKAANSCLNL